jgi:hypothetical protein
VGFLLTGCGRLCSLGHSCSAGWRSRFPRDATALGTDDGQRLHLAQIWPRPGSRLQSRGALLGRIRAGRVVATPNVVVRCWKYKRRLASGMIRYRGVREGCTDVTFHVFSDDGTWRVRSKGRGINVSGVARGSLTLDGASRGRTGTYSIAGGEFRPWPRERHTYSLAR